MSEIKAWDIKIPEDAYKKRPPIKYVVDGFFPTHSLNIVYGAPASMKSMLMGDLCAAVVSGSDWLPETKSKEGIKVEQGPVFWVDLDNGSRRTDERVEALSRARNIKPDDPFYYVSMPNPPLIMGPGNLDVMLYFQQVIGQLGISLVVIDNLGLVNGRIDENSAEMANVMADFRSLAERTGAAIVIIHHQRKGSTQAGRAGDSLRGHSSIEASVDLAILIEREVDGSDIILRSTKTRGVDVRPIEATFTYDHKPGTKDLHNAIFYGLGAKPTPVELFRDVVVSIVEVAGQIKKTALALDAKREYEATYGDVFGTNKAREIIEKMVDEGVLHASVGERNSQVISFTEGSKIPF